MSSEREKALDLLVDYAREHASLIGEDAACDRAEGIVRDALATPVADNETGSARQMNHAVNADVDESPQEVHPQVDLAHSDRTPEAKADHRSRTESVGLVEVTASGQWYSGVLEAYQNSWESGVETPTTLAPGEYDLIPRSGTQRDGA